MNNFEVVFYEKANGEEPAKEFLLSLDEKMRIKMLRIISLLETNGIKLRKPFSEHLEDGIFELRAQFGSDISRIMYFFFYGGRIILTHGFIKKTQKTPRKEIEKAKIYRDDYIKREG
ncbi:MAG: type II toxin-antitoxin system RelE/ParE family toxin [Synergistaceae bacterium]|nr:type II toxin-antitoxin system RelE/ParE family toxin [Synergistaceae bacterium]